MRSKEAEAVAAGAALYASAFVAVKDQGTRQEALGALLAHTGSGSPQEVQGALDTLLQISGEDAAALLPFASFVNSLLDYLDRFDDAALKAMFRVFCDINGAALADKRLGNGRGEEEEDGDGDEPMYSPSQPMGGPGTQRGRGGGGALNPGGGACDELHIVLRKQLFSRDLRYKRIGLLGAVQLVARLHAATSAAAAAAGSGAGGSARAHAIVKSLLATTLEAVRPCVPAEALLYDLLAELVEAGELCDTVMKLVQEACCSDFEVVILDDFTESEGGSGRDPPPSELAAAAAGGAAANPREPVWLNLDGDLTSVALRLWPEIQAGRPSAERLSVVPPLFRLLAALELKEQGTLEGIDGMLGCPLRMPWPESAEVGDTESGTDGGFMRLPPDGRGRVALAVFTAIAWLREAVGTFLGGGASAAAAAGGGAAGGDGGDGGGGGMAAPSEDINRKVAQRLRSLAQLESMLTAMVAADPSVLSALPDLCEGSGRSQTAPSASVVLLKGPAKKAGRKAKAGKENSAPAKKRKKKDAGSDDEDGEEAEGGAGGGGGAAKGGPLLGWQRLMRPLSPAALQVLLLPASTVEAVMPTPRGTGLPRGSHGLFGAALLLAKVSQWASQALAPKPTGFWAAAAAAAGSANGPAAQANLSEIRSAGGADACADALHSIVPALRRFLDMSLQVLSVRDAPELDPLEGELPCLAQYSRDVSAAAAAVHTHTLRILRVLLAWAPLAQQQQHQGLLHDLLAAFQEAPGAGGGGGAAARTRRESGALPMRLPSHEAYPGCLRRAPKSARKSGRGALYNMPHAHAPLSRHFQRHNTLNENVGVTSS